MRPYVACNKNPSRSNIQAEIGSSLTFTLRPDCLSTEFRTHIPLRQRNINSSCTQKYHKMSIQCHKVFWNCSQRRSLSLRQTAGFLRTGDKRIFLCYFEWQWYPFYEADLPNSQTVATQWDNRQNMMTANLRSQNMTATEHLENFHATNVKFKPFGANVH